MRLIEYLIQDSRLPQHLEVGNRQFAGYDIAAGGASADMPGEILLKTAMTMLCSLGYHCCIVQELASSAEAPSGHQKVGQKIRATSVGVAEKNELELCRNIRRDAVDATEMPLQDFHVPVPLQPRIKDTHFTSPVLSTTAQPSGSQCFRLADCLEAHLYSNGRHSVVNALVVEGGAGTPVLREADDGWAMTAPAASLRSQFRFGILVRFVNIRAAGTRRRERAAIARAG